MVRPWIGLGVLAISLWCAAAHGGSFHVSPVRLELSANRTNTVLTVRNSDEQAVRIQLQLVSWAQEGSRDIYEPTLDLIANPPIFTLGPKGSQTVRIGLVKPMSAVQELSYRIFLEELADPSQIAAPSGLKLQLRIGLPIFVVPPQVVKPGLKWVARAAPDAKGMIQLSLRNDGAAHIQVRELKVFATGNDSALGTVTAADYVLPGNSRQWLIKPERRWTGEQLRVSAQTDAGAFNADVALESP